MNINRAVILVSVSKALPPAMANILYTSVRNTVSAALFFLLVIMTLFLEVLLVIWVYMVWIRIMSLVQPLAFTPM